MSLQRPWLSVFAVASLILFGGVTLSATVSANPSDVGVAQADAVRVILANIAKRAPELLALVLLVGLFLWQQRATQKSLLESLDRNTELFGRNLQMLELMERRTHQQHAPVDPEVMVSVAQAAGGVDEAELSDLKKLTETPGLREIMQGQVTSFTFHKAGRSYWWFTEKGRSKLISDPQDTDRTIIRFEGEAGCALPPHWHIHEETLTVESGTLMLSVQVPGESGQPGDNEVVERTLKPGDTFSVPGSTWHWALFPEETVLLITWSPSMDIRIVDRPF